MPVNQLMKKSKALLEGSLKHTRNAALASLLVPLGSVEAGGPSVDNTSRVDATVTDTSGTGIGPFLYEFEVFNTSDFFPSGSGGGLTPLIIDWELPLFALTDVDQSTITSPADWGFQILNDSDATPPPNFEDVWTYNAATDPIAQAGDYGPNPEAFENPPLVLHWLTGDLELPQSPISPGDSLGGFSFESSFSSFAAPYQASWEFLPQNTGDPPIPNNAFGTPNSPARQAAQGIPEPGTLAMLGFGIVSLLTGMGWGRASDSRLSTSVIDTSG